MIDLNEFDDYDEDGEVTITYYILGDRPIKVTCIDDVPDSIYAYSFETRAFERDGNMLRIINDSMDIRKVDELEYRNKCLSVGVKPI